MKLPPTTEEVLSTLNRALPFSDDAERGVLSCLMQSPERIASNLHSMPPDLFYSPPNREVFTTLVDLVVAGKPVDPVTVMHSVRSLGKLDLVGGPGAISELFSFVPIPSHFAFYLSTVRELHKQRKHIGAHARSLSVLFAARDGEVAAAVDATKGIIEDAGQDAGQLLKSYTVAQSLDPLMQEIEERSRLGSAIAGIPTGLATLDKRTGGMLPGQVWVAAGEPGDGKSCLLQTMAEAAALAGHAVRWYPLEMPRNEQMLRLLSSAARVDNGSLYTGKLTNGEQQSIAAACRRLKDYPMELVDVEDATASDIFADIERSDCKVVVLDYLQLLDDVSPRKSDTREGILANISRRQKSLARRTGKTIITASQLNDGGKLRESRAIGQDADKVLIIRKCEDKRSDTGFDDSKRQLWCEKNRGGARHWELPLQFLGSVFQFRE
jgi:replicative DNA helicase